MKPENYIEIWRTGIAGQCYRIHKNAFIDFWGDPNNHEYLNNDGIAQYMCYVLGSDIKYPRCDSYDTEGTMCYETSDADGRDVWFYVSAADEEKAEAWLKAAGADQNIVHWNDNDNN